MTEDIVELETKIAFLEKYINELSDALYAQQKQIDELSEKYIDLKDHLNSAEPSGGITTDNEKPPHY